MKDWIRWTAAFGASAVLVYMAFLSLQHDVTLRTETALVLLALIFGLLYGLDELTRLVEAFKNGGGRER